jgi:hypothetical protein
MRKRAIVLFILLLLACILFLFSRPDFSVSITIEQRDKSNKVVDNFVVDNMTTDPPRLNVKAFDTILVTAEAEFRNGLESLWIEGESHCFEPTDLNTPYMPKLSERGTLLLIPSQTGNAIPLNTTPARFSFTEKFPVTCKKLGYRILLRAGAKTVETTGIFGSKPVISRTAEVAGIYVEADRKN